MGTKFNLDNDLGQQPDDVPNNQNINQQNFNNNDNNIQGGGNQFDMINNNNDVENQDQFINQEEFEDFRLQDLNQNLTTDEIFDNYDDSDLIEDDEGDIGENNQGTDGDELNLNSDRSDDR